MAKITRYKNQGYTTLPFENGSENWMVVVGISPTSGTTFTANTGTILLEVEDPNEKMIDVIIVEGLNYIGAPTTGGTILMIQLQHRMLVPPGGSVDTTGGLITSIQVIEAQDTSQFDGKDSLENALAIK